MLWLRPWAHWLMIFISCVNGEIEDYDGTHDKAGPPYCFVLDLDTGNYSKVGHKAFILLNGAKFTCQRENCADNSDVYML